MHASFLETQNSPCSRFRYQLSTPFHTLSKGSQQNPSFYLTAGGGRGSSICLSHTAGVPFTIYSGLSDTGNNKVTEVESCFFPKRKKKIQYCKTHKFNYSTSSHAWSKLTHSTERLQQNKIKNKKER